MLAVERGRNARFFFKKRGEIIRVGIAEARRYLRGGKAGVSKKSPRAGDSSALNVVVHRFAGVFFEYAPNVRLRIVDQRAKLAHRKAFVEALGDKSFYLAADRFRSGRVARVERGYLFNITDDRAQNGLRAVERGHIRRQSVVFAVARRLSAIAGKANKSERFAVFACRANVFPHPGRTL